MSSYQVSASTGKKCFALCTTNIVQLPSMLAVIVVLKHGETRKYLGFLHGPEAQDTSVGEQLVSTLLKSCLRIQSPYHTLAARVVMVNSIIMGQMWHLLTVWVPTPAEMKSLQQVVRCFLWGKTTEQGCRGARVSREKVTQLKEDGRLGVIDPGQKALVFHGQWVVKTICPGSEPWKSSLRSKLARAQPMSGSAGAWQWVLSEHPSLPGYNSKSCFWKSVWRGWQLLWSLLKLKTPAWQDKVLALPVFGADRVWSKNEPAPFDSPAATADLTASRATTLSAFWHSADGRWFTTSELEDIG